MLPNFDASEACSVAERIRQSIEETNFPVIGRGFVTTTIGVSTSPTSVTLDQLETAADAVAMQTKKSGKNQVVHCSGNAKLASAHVTTKTLDKELSHLKRLWC